MKINRPIVCAYCGQTGTSLWEFVGGKSVRRFQRGWNGQLYCSKECEIKGLKSLFSSVPHAGSCTRFPDQIQQEIDARWEDIEG